LAFFRSLERSIGNIASTTAGLICFMTIDIYELGTTLTNAKIFATIALMGTLKLLIPYVSIALSFGFELQIIFQRFCTILNIKNQRMIQIDPISKEPIK
jgi:hypothetical protein